MKRKIYCTSNTLSLVECLPRDDEACYKNWFDKETQNGFNFILDETFDEYCKNESNQRFTAIILRNDDNTIIGSVSISPLNTTPDLAIWLFRPFRRQGYGTLAFSLATKYAVETLHINELHAGVYQDNINSIKMLEKCGYIPFPQGNLIEKHYLTGENTVQMDYIYKPIKIA